MRELTGILALELDAANQISAIWFGEAKTRTTRDLQAAVQGYASLAKECTTEWITELDREGRMSMPDYPIIDIHMHTYPTPAIAIQAMGGKARVGFTGTHAELVPFMAEAGIEKVVLVNFTPVYDMASAARAKWPNDLRVDERQEREEELRLEMVSRIKRRNAWSCDEAKAHPELIPFISIDPMMGAEAMEQEIEAWARQGVKGIKLHAAVQRVHVDDRRLWPAYAAAERLGIIFQTHMGSFYEISGEYAHPALFAEVVTAFPKLKAILAHCGGRENFDAAIALAKECPNVVFDSTAISAGSPGPGDLDDQGLANLFRALGVDRVAFGSDWCFRDPRPDVERIIRLPLTEDEKRLLLRDNAARWLGL